MSQQSSSSSGIGFTGLLTVAFIVLKLCGVINWSWWWVLSPIWISILLVVVLVLSLATISVIKDDLREKRQIRERKARELDLLKYEKKMRDL